MLLVMKIGMGYDIHPLVKGCPLILGGMTIPSGVGLQGHSDGDVVIHAICNALLGALGEADLGTRFPDRDARYRGCSSTLFLEDIRRLIEKENFRIVNIDTVIIAEGPHLAPHVESMRIYLAEVLGVEMSRVNVKPSHPEGIGALGKNEGIAAHAVCLIEEG